ncbi:MAG: hypothetical protein DRN25_02690 [Thermoplasmata archaeon]|nr:MAG: hypothetical protein DRN25_02690 [Thermoplasmata archaeon]
MRKTGKKIAIYLAVIFLVSALIPAATGTTLKVEKRIQQQAEKPVSDENIYVPDDYPTIQEAVDHARSGDTIIVRDGTYIENVVIDKPHLTIKSENGSKKCIVKAKSQSKPVFEIDEDYIALTGFTIMGRSYGILLLRSQNNEITNNVISNNAGDGISLLYSRNNNIENNIISNNERIGIDLTYSQNNIIANNEISENEGWGIILEGSSNNNDITENRISKNGWGIYLDRSYCNKIHCNNFENNNLQAKFLYDGLLDLLFAIFFPNRWYGNYWSDYGGSGDYVIEGQVVIHMIFWEYTIQWRNYDRSPSTEPN